MPISGNGVVVFRAGGCDFPAPYWRAPDSALYLGDVREQLRRMPARSVQTCVTSPPYWGLRDYGTGQWEGGSANCDHQGPPATAIGGRSLNDRWRGIVPPDDKPLEKQQLSGAYYKETCRKCGAKRIDMQIGAEPSPDCGTHGEAQCGACFVCSMVGVFREVYRVLRDDGTCWLNLGDTYATDRSGTTPPAQTAAGGVGGLGGVRERRGQSDGYNPSRDCKKYGISHGNLIGVPWRVALALQADGWVLRQDIIWHSPNKMPESVTNRCTKSHEHIFLLAKGEGYYYDAVAIEEDMVSAPHAPGNKKLDASRNDHDQMGTVWGADGSKNKRDVWIVPTTGYTGAHFAVFSPRLITPCIQAGTSEHGCCARCGMPYERVVVRVGAVKQEGESGIERDRSFRSSRNGVDSTLDSGIAAKDTVGWRKPCGCQTDEMVPCVVLDPFVGSGTTVATATSLGRAGVGIDLSETYLCQNAIPRIVEAVQTGGTGRKSTSAMPTATRPLRVRMRGH